MLMDDYIYNLSLDLNCNKSMPSINSAQFDKNRKFAVSITANGEPFSVLGCQATLKCIHSDKSSSSLDCTDGISQTGTTVTVTLRENTLPVRGMTAAKLVFSDGTRNYSTQIFLIDVDSSLDGNIRAKEEFSVLNKLIDDVRDVIDNANNTMISGYESLTPDITFDIENSNVAGYLTNDDYTFTNDNAYNGADYASTNVPVTIDSTVNERPNGGDIAIPEGGVKLTLYDTVAKTKWSVNVSGDTYTVKNLIPNRLYTYVVSDTNGVVIKTGSCKASGQIRFIDAGKATTYDTTDPTTTFERFIFNIRDLGGWECDGGHLKYGLIYRGCRLNGNYAVGQTRYGISISPSQIDFFKNFLGIRDELDLRQVKDDPDLGNTETAGDDAIYDTADDIKDTALGIGVDYTIIPINPYLTGVEIKSSNAEMNRRYANVIKRIARDIKEGKPCYIHCLEGADRTGTLVMLILAICGVSRADIERDYELTSYSKDYAGHRNRRTRIDTAQNYRWMNLMVYLLGNSFTGSSFRDKVVDYVLKIGVTIEEINTIRAGLIDGEPEKISSPYTDASVQYYLTNVITDNPVSSIPMYQPFEATLTALNIQNVVVTMGGTDITLTVYSQGKISIPRVTGNITVTATASGSEYDDTELRELIADYNNGYSINGFALESGTVDASGEEVENNKAMRMTEMIPYASVISCDFLSRTGNLYIAYYDSEGNFVTRVGYTPTQTAVLSSNYPYFRMCFYENVTPSHTETEFKSWVTLKTKTAIKSELDEKADQADVTAALNTKADLADVREDYISLSEALTHRLSAADGAVKTANLDSGAVTEDKLESVVREKLNSIDSETVTEATQDYLAAHPELTTTVQDGSLIVKKITAVSRSNVMANKVTPEMFGAVGDGETDDSDAIQMAIDFASSHYSTAVYGQAPGIHYTPYDSNNEPEIFTTIKNEISWGTLKNWKPVKSHGTRVEFAAKTYYISKPIVLRNPQDVYLYGNGGSGSGITTITRTSKTSGVTDNNPKSCFDFYGCRTGFISGISFRGSEYGIRFLDASYDNNYDRDATYSYNGKTYNSSDAARMICRVSNLVVDNCTFFNNTISGVDISTVVGYVYFRNCTITPGANNATGIRIGVNFSNPVHVNPNYIFMDRCNFMLDGTGRTGIAVYLCSHLTVTDCDFANGDTAVSLDYPDPYGDVAHANRTTALSFLHNKFFNNKYAFKYSDTELGRSARGIIIAENAVNLNVDSSSNFSGSSRGFCLQAASSPIAFNSNCFIANSSTPNVNDTNFHAVDFGTGKVAHEFRGNVDGYINKLYAYCTFNDVMKSKLSNDLCSSNIANVTVAAGGSETVTLGDTHDWAQISSVFSTNQNLTVSFTQNSNGTVTVTVGNSTASSQSGLIIGTLV